MPCLLNSTDKQSVVLERLLLVLEELLCNRRVEFSEPPQNFGCKMVVQEAPEFVEAAAKESLLNRQ